MSLALAGLSNVSDIGEYPCDGIHDEVGMQKWSTILSPSPGAVPSLGSPLFHYPACAVCPSLHLASLTLRDISPSDHPEVLLCLMRSQIQLILLRGEGIMQNAVFP